MFPTIRGTQLEVRNFEKSLREERKKYVLFDNGTVRDFRDLAL
ncbi:hypothetical protein P4K47_19200 [Bacillus cereus]